MFDATEKKLRKERRIKKQVVRYLGRFSDYRYVFFVSNGRQNKRFEKLKHLDLSSYLTPTL